ncbi:MAG: FAD-dependent oxidoreductase, partial [Kurthia sp.]
IFNAHIIRYVGDEKVSAIQTANTLYETDYVIEAIGVTPNTDFLVGSGIEINDNATIQVDAQMRTTVQHIYAAGDCAMHYHRIKKQADYIPLGTTANKQGRIAGLNMAGHSEEFAGIVGTSLLKFFNLTIGKTGINEKEAKKLQKNYEYVTRVASNVSSYYPDGEDMYIKMIWEKETKKIAGVQIVGGAGVDKRIDVAAVALFHEMTLRDLIDLDIAYAPPYNGVWDPLLSMAKRQL